MAKFNFYLRDLNSKQDTPIYLFINWKGNRYKYPTKISVNPKDWNDKKQTIIESKNKPEHREYNRKLAHDLASVKELFIRFENDNKRQPTVKELKDLLQTELLGHKAEETDTLILNFIDKFINESKSRTNPKTGKPIARGTIDTYNQLRHHLNNYCKLNKKQLHFEDITLDFYHDFNKYMVEEGLSTNTIGKRIAILKTILRESVERGLNENLAFQSRSFRVNREKTENIYLDENELSLLLDLDLSANKRLEGVRDLFLIGCWTGLRFSDFSRLSTEHLKGNFIEIETQKTREEVVIPLHPTVRIILEKYSNNLPRALSNQKMNEYLKEIGSLVKEFHVKTLKKITKGGKEISIQIQKFNRITTHTARRSFASNLFLKGIPSQSIMKITGHRTEKSFMQYIKITPKENAKIIQMIWDKEVSKLKLV